VRLLGLHNDPRQGIHSHSLEQVLAEEKMRQKMACRLLLTIQVIDIYDLHFSASSVKPLKKLVLDLSDKDIITVNDLKKVTQQEEYIARFKAPDRPNLSKRTGTFASIEGIKEEDFSPKPPPKAKKASSQKTPPQTTVVPKSCKLNVTNSKISEIYEELKLLKLATNRNAIAVLLRVFLETSVDHYLTQENILLTFPTPNGNKDKSLKKKVDETIADMVTKGATLKDFQGITKGLSDVNHPALRRNLTKRKQAWI